MCNLTKDEVAVGCKKAVREENLNPRKVDSTKCEIRRRKEDLIEEMKHSHFADCHLMDSFDDE